MGLAKYVHYNEVSLYQGSFPCILLLLEQRKSFAIPRTSLYRGSLYRSSTVILVNKRKTNKKGNKNMEKNLTLKFMDLHVTFDSFLLLFNLIHFLLSLFSKFFEFLFKFQYCLFQALIESQSTADPCKERHKSGKH